MKRVIVMATAAIIVAGLVSIAITSLFLPERAYTVTDVQAGLRSNPRAWIGRTVIVHGGGSVFSGHPYD